MAWASLIQQYNLYSGNASTLASYTYSNAGTGKKTYDLLSVRLISGEVSSIEHCCCSNDGNVSWGLQKRDYVFRAGKLGRYKSVATYELKPLPSLRLEPHLLSALEELIQEQPQLERTIRGCLGEIK